MEIYRQRKEEKMAETNMRDSFLGFLRGHRVQGWDGNRAEPLSCCVYEAAVKLVEALPAGNFELFKRGSDDKCLVWAEIHQAAHEDALVFRFYAKPEMFGPAYFAIMVDRDGKYVFEFEGREIYTHGVTNSATRVAKMLIDHLSELGDLMIDSR